MKRKKCIWMKFLGIIFLLMTSQINLYSQYHLNEAGAFLGLGSNIPLDGKTVKPYYAYNFNGFYSHYRCGKRDGFHAEIGMRGFRVNEKAVENGFLQSENTGKHDYHFMYLDLGLMYKIRREKYHRDKETAILVGPKLNVRASSFHYNDSTKLQRYNPNDYRDLTLLIPGIHLSFLSRIPFRPKKTYFIRYGGEFYFLPNAKTDKQNFSSIYLFIQLGIPFWNNL